MLKQTIILAGFVLFLSSCETQVTKEVAAEPAVCDCKELQHDPDYNVFHLGDRLKPFTGQCLDYYRGGQLKKDYHLVDGKYEGLLKYYHPNGSLRSAAEHQKGLLFGDKKVYDDKGTLLFHATYVRSRLKETIFNINQPAVDSTAVID